MRWLSLLLPGVLSSCWFFNSRSLTSTDVDNELTVAISGTATTGMALSRDTLQLYDAQGALVQSTVTDSMGQFQLKTKRKISEYQGLWTLYSKAHQLRVAVPSPDAQGQSYALLNPVGDYLYHKVGSSAKDAQGFNRSADSLLAQLFGQGLNYQQMNSAVDFHSIGQTQPHPLAGLFYQLQNFASAEGQEIDVYLDSILKQGAPLFESDQFVIGLLHQGELRGMDSLALRQSVEKWRGGQMGTPLDSLYGAIREMQTSPGINQLNPPTAQLVMDGYNLMQSRFLGPPPVSMGLPQESLDTLSNQWQQILPLVDSVMIGTGLRIQNWIGVNYLQDDRGRTLMNQLGDRMGGCLALYRADLRQLHLAASAQVCNRMMGGTMTPLSLEAWILRGDSMAIKPMMDLGRRELMRQVLEQHLQTEAPFLLPLLP